ncbi:esterase, partial [Lacticaseibacillus rhamnosus]
MQRRKRISGILITALMIAAVFLIWWVPSWAPSKSGQSSTSAPRQVTSASASKIVNRSTISTSTSSESSVTSPQAASSLNESSFFSPTLNRSWRYFTYLPAGYTSSHQYPLILMLHGMDGDATNLVKLVDSKTMLDQAVTATKHPAVVVFIDGGNSFYVDSPAEKMQTAI